MFSRMMLGSIVLCQVALYSVPVAALDPRVAGAWRTERYILRDGSQHPLDGLIFFTEKDWTVLFFVLDGEKEPQRGSGEGGTYTLDGEHLTFTHVYHLSAGKQLGSLAASPLRMEIDHLDPSTEPCRVEIEGERMVIFFPSGNKIDFRRSSR
jgi:hypothetical protein